MTFEEWFEKVAEKIDNWYAKENWLNLKATAKSVWEASRDNLNIKLPYQEKPTSSDKFDDGYAEAIEEVEKVLKENGVKYE